MASCFFLIRSSTERDRMTKTVTFSSLRDFGFSMSPRDVYYRFYKISPPPHHLHHHHHHLHHHHHRRHHHRRRLGRRLGRVGRPDLGRPEGSFRGVRKSPKSAPGLPGLKNLTVMKGFIHEIAWILEPARNRDFRPLGPVGFPSSPKFIL